MLSSRYQTHAAVLRNTIVALSLLLALPSCENVTNEEIGSGVGLVVGALAGAAFGDGGGQVAAAFTGALVGTIAGSVIGKRLDEADRLKAQNASLAALALPTGETVEWTSEESTTTNGTATPISSPVTIGGEQCRNVREVVVIDGEETTQISKYCKSADGRWRVTG